MLHTVAYVISLPPNPNNNHIPQYSTIFHALGVPHVKSKPMALGHTSLREASKLHVMSKDLPSNRHYVHLPMLPLISHFFISHHKAFNIHEYFPPCGCIISQPWPIKTLNLLIPRFLITFFYPWSNYQLTLPLASQPSLQQLAVN